MSGQRWEQCLVFGYFVCCELVAMPHPKLQATQIPSVGAYGFSSFDIELIIWRSLIMV
jgi:hypothetical protein